LTKRGEFEPEENPEGDEQAEVYTMTMAEIYAAQGQLDKAIYIYETILNEPSLSEDDNKRIVQRLEHLIQLKE